MSFVDLLSAARDEYQSAKTQQRWHSHKPASAKPKGNNNPNNNTKKTQEELVALRAELSQLKGKPPTKTDYDYPSKPSKPFEKEYGPGKDFQTKEQFFNWKWQRPATNTPVTKNGKTWYFCLKCNSMTWHPTENCRLPDGVTKTRPKPRSTARANVAKINSRENPLDSNWIYHPRAQPNPPDDPWASGENWTKPPVRDERGDTEPATKTNGLEHFE